MSKVKSFKTEPKSFKLPEVSSIIEIKKEKILAKISESNSSLEQNSQGSDKRISYVSFAKKILSDLDAEKAVAALVYMAHRNELDESSYRAIETVQMRDYKKRTDRSRHFSGSKSPFSRSRRGGKPFSKPSFRSSKSSGRSIFKR